MVSYPSCRKGIASRARGARCWSLPLIGLLFLFVACSGKVMDEGTSGEGGGEGGEAGGGSQGGEGGEPAACSASSPTPLRRLSRTEYWATLRDLFAGIEVGRPVLTPDIRVKGFENRATNLFATENNVGELQKAAIGVASKAVASLPAFLPCATTGDPACETKFLEDFGLRAFRRPLTSEEKQRYKTFFDKVKADTDFKSAVQLTIEAFIQTPQFLYRADLGDPSKVNEGRVQFTDWEMASRLSYFLWGSMPDAELFAAAKAGKLTKDADIVAAADRMVKDPKTKAQLVDFHRQWLDYDHVNEVYQKEGEKDQSRYASYNAELRSAMREESDRFTEHVMFDGTGTLKELLTSRDTFVNAPLADLYGVPKPASGWQSATLPAGQRAGFLTRGAFLASHAHKVSGSPPLRAAFIMQNLLCIPRLPPPADADTSEPVAKTGEPPKTNRQLFEQRVNEQSKCQPCHNIMDPIGFPFESYDAIGKHRETDNGFPVDTSGALEGTDVDGPVKNALELSEKLADSRMARACMTSRWLEYTIGQDLADGVDDCRVAKLTAELDRAKGDVRALLLAVVKSPDFLSRLSE